ncbi:uncharacterized protein LOC112088869 [Eutrema salsugineum]|uniref:uncharacterized protein LOC112088869 n=1 Tax=Eutrema salsugineum TaxID=72664 RepID=UPI000CED0198|nr:uncharacterized protein LOC112088869 [Eutrema salsugineum]
MELVENLAMSNDTYGEYFDRANRSEGSSEEQRMKKDIRELQSKLDKVLMATQKPIHFVGGFDEHVPSFDNQLLQGQQRVESQHATMQQDIRELKQNQASTSSRGPALPGKPEPNPKEYVNAITLRSGKELQAPASKTKLIEANGQLGGEAASDDAQQEEVLEKEPIKDKGKEVEKTPELEKPYRRSIPRKLSDPGSFTLPCAIGHLKFSNCSCDLGASVSLMPYTVARRLGFKSYKPAKISLVLADRSVRLPVGLLEDLPLRIGEIEIPTDFIVLEMD